MKLSEGVLATVLAFATACCTAAEVGGHTLPDTITRFGEQYTLSGCGMRELLFSDIYLLGMYLPEPLADPQAISRSSRVFLLKVLYKGDLPEDLPERWSEPLAEQLSDEYVDILQDVYDKVDSGDIVEFSFRSGSNEELRINGVLEIREPQAALMPAITSLWLGENPVSGNLKRLLLKGSCD